MSSFIPAFRIKEGELVCSPYHPGGGAIFDFIRKLTPAVCKYVQDNAPEERRSDVTQVYKKALNFKLNRRAAVQRDTVVPRNGTVRNSDPASLSKRLAVQASSVGLLRVNKFCGNLIS